MVEVSLCLTLCWCACKSLPGWPETVEAAQSACAIPCCPRVLFPARCPPLPRRLRVLSGLGWPSTLQATQTQGCHPRTPALHSHPTPQGSSMVHADLLHPKHKPALERAARAGSAVWGPTPSSLPASRWAWLWLWWAWFHERWGDRCGRERGEQQGDARACWTLARACGTLARTRMAGGAHPGHPQGCHLCACLRACMKAAVASPREGRGFP